MNVYSIHETQTSIRLNREVGMKLLYIKSHHFTIKGLEQCHISQKKEKLLVQKKEKKKKKKENFYKHRKFGQIQDL